MGGGEPGPCTPAYYRHVGVSDIGLRSKRSPSIHLYAHTLPRNAWRTSAVVSLYAE